MSFSPLQDNVEANLYEEFHLASAEIPGGGSGGGGRSEVGLTDVVLEAPPPPPPVPSVHPEGGPEELHQQGTFEPGMPYNLDASMSPEGRREFEEQQQRY